MAGGLRGAGRDLSRGRAPRPSIPDYNFYVAGRGAIQAAIHVASHEDYKARELMLLLSVYNLIAFAMEALFKACIVHAGVLTSDDMANPPYGHRLANLMRKAVEFGLQVDDLLEQLVLKMDGPYSRHEYRYMPDMAYDKFDLEVILAIVDRLEDQVGVLTDAKARILAAQ